MPSLPRRRLSLRSRAVAAVVLSIVASTFSTAYAVDHQVIELWPNGAPGEKSDIGKERETTKPTDNQIAGLPVSRIGFVSKPTITIYRPPADKDTGAAVVVAPGGGYHILAWDLEGTEVCEWLNSIGVTGILLKYRVPRREGIERYAGPIQDAQRAMGIVRARAAEWKIDPKRIGMLGFSAGGHLTAMLSTNYDTRLYPAVDEADQQNCRPDFAVLIYPGGLVNKAKGNEVSAELKISKDTPPTFMAITQDDNVGVENVMNYALALNKEKVPLEVHIFPTGGHGYGLRKTDSTAVTWPDRVADWMNGSGWLKKP